MSSAATIDELRARSLVFCCYAHLFGPERVAWVDGTVDRLVELLDRLGRDDVRELLSGVPAPEGTSEIDVLDGQWVRWFDQGRIPPYECSNTPQSAAGHTGALADIAGFYAAFGRRISGERPDHLVAELEFMALVTLVEAEAIASGAAEQREVSASAARTFVRDHLGIWLDPWAARVAAADGGGPWGRAAMSVARFVACEAERRNVLPVRSAVAFPGDIRPFDEEPPAPVCGDESPLA
jgi:nitrate reductase assembly molybdenum cofactor insertion protein NarJ